MYDWRLKSKKDIVKFVMTNHETFKSVRGRMQPLMDMVTKLFLPRTHDMKQSRKPQDAYGISIYDHIPATASRKFAAGFVSQTVSKRDESEQSWVNFVASKQKTMEIDRVKQYMQEAAEQVRSGFDRSTFYRDNAFRQQVHDASVLWGVMTAEPDLAKDRVVFRRRDPRTHWFGVNGFGDIDVDHFELEMSTKDLVEQFDKEQLPDKVTKEFEEGKITGKHRVLEAIYVNGSIRKGFHHNTDKPFIRFYILMSGGESKENSLLSMDGQDWRPSVLRIGETLVSGYPLTMAMDALTSATRGNVFSKHGILGSSLMIQPPKRIHENLRDQIIRNRGLNPNSNVYYSKEEEKIEHLNQKIDPRFVMEWLDREDGAVEDRFFIPFFETMTRLQAQEGSWPTATQINQTVTERIGQLTPVIEASEDDSLEPNVDKIWQYEIGAGRMPEPPDELFEDVVDGKVRILNRFNGQLAHLKRTLRQNQGVVEALAIIGEFKELYPTSLIVVRAKKLLEKTLTNRIGQDMIFTDVEVAEIEAALAEVQQREQNLDTAERMAKVIPSITKDAVDPNSPAALALAG